jgi:hypothetical protein
MKKSTIVGLIIILGLALMVLVSLFRDRPLSSVQFQESQESVDQVALSGARRSLGRWTPRPVGNGLSGFEGWYEQLPDWLASNGFPAHVFPETQSLAVSLRAMYAETNTTPNIARVGGVLAADGNLSRVFSNMFSESLSQIYLIDLELSSRLFDATFSKIRSFNE